MDTAVTSESTAIAEARARLAEHALYPQLTSTAHLRIFMSHHVFAVWDFFSLLKRLQSEVTCVSVPWLPRHLGDHARFITEIVLAEECDEGLDGHHLSHFELYLSAMDEVGADRRPIDALVGRLADGVPAIEALDAAEIPPSAREFVSHTLEVAIDGQLHEVAASFCHGRENLLPDVFISTRDAMAGVLVDAPRFTHYLERHITLDHDEHGPLALRLLDAACEGDPVRIAAANRAALDAIEARGRLWDGVLAEIEGGAGQSAQARHAPSAQAQHAPSVQGQHAPSAW